MRSPLLPGLLLVMVWGASQSPALARDAALNWSRDTPPAPSLQASSPSSVANTLKSASATGPAPATTLEAIIDHVATQLQLDARLLHAMIHVESRYNPEALSSKGAVGLMQVMPATAERFGYTDLRHPSNNVRAGATYFRWLLDHFEQDLELALAGYNAGEGAVKKYGRAIPPYPETRDYVAKVMQRYREGPSPVSAPRLTSPTSRLNTPRNKAAFGQNAQLALGRALELLLSSPPPVTQP